MPEYAGFNIFLTSQYDAATIPEDQVRVVTRPTLRSLHLDSLTYVSPGLSQQHPDKTFSDLHLQRKSTVIETYIPVYSSSQFWICYDCPPLDQDGDDKVKYYYFKLFVSGICVLSWGIGEQDSWRGKTMFALFHGGRDFEGKRIVEKRGLFFPVAGLPDAHGFEIRTFRAKARRREQPKYQNASDVVGAGGALDLTSIGKVQRGERQRHYAYALLDAKDEPWVTFRYRFETDEDDTLRVQSTFLSTGLESTETSIATEVLDIEESHAEVTESSVWSNLEQNTPPQQQPSTIHHAEDQATTRRLSFPPRTTLASTTTRVEPSSPIKQQASASDDDLTRPRVQSYQYSSMAFAEGTMSRRTTGLRKREWTAVRAASPAERPGVPGSEKVQLSYRKSASTSGSGGLLKSVVASALRRKEERSR